MVVIPSDKSISYKKLEGITGFKLEPLNNKDIWNFINCDINYIPPFGSLWNMNTYIDKGIMK